MAYDYSSMDHRRLFETPPVDICLPWHVSCSSAPFGPFFLTGHGTLELRRDASDTPPRDTVFLAFHYLTLIIPCTMYAIADSICERSVEEREKHFVFVTIFCLKVASEDIDVGRQGRKSRTCSASDVPLLLR